MHTSIPVLSYWTQKRRLKVFLAEVGKMSLGGREKWSFPSTQHWWGQICNTVSGSGPPELERHVHTWRSSIYSHQDQGTSATFPWEEAERAETFQPGEEVAWQRSPHCLKIHEKYFFHASFEAVKRMGSCSFLSRWVPGQKAMGTNRSRRGYIQLQWKLFLQLVWGRDLES